MYQSSSGPHASMPEPAETNDPLPGTQSNDKEACRSSEAILEDILATMRKPEPQADDFPPGEKETRVWSAYERMAKQHDDDFLERHNNDMDVILIFAGLFSAVNSAFIVNMESDLSPNSSDTTNALLKILINKVDNGTFSDHDASLPVWNGPSSTIIWIQTLAYTGLFTSLLAAFGAVLGKQWLTHFKTSRFGQGVLHERFKCRQRKLDEMESWHFSTIMATFPIFLQLSLLFFGISLAANIWIQQHTIASVIVAATGFGAIFYSFTLVVSLKSPDCPFQTPISTVTEHLIQRAVSFREMLRSDAVWQPQSWAGVLGRVLCFIEDTLRIVKDVVTDCVSCALEYISRILSALRRRVRSLAHNPESAGSRESPVSLKPLDLSCLDSPVDAVQPRAIQQILETSTDTEVITAAVMMVPEVKWPARCDIIYRLIDHFEACFDPTWQGDPLAKRRAAACLKAMCYIDLVTYHHLFRIREHGIFIYGRREYSLPRDRCFLLVSCALVGPNELDITSLPLSDRMWLALMFTYRLYQKRNSSSLLDFLPDFIDKCLDDRSSPPRLVADCLLLSGMMIGLRPERRYLTRFDKSVDIPKLLNWVIVRILDLLQVLGEPSLSQQDFRNTRRLLRPLAHPHEHRIQKNHDVSKRWIKLCFRSLEDERPGTSGADDRFKDIATIIRHALLSSSTRENYWIWLFMHEIGPTIEMYWIGRPEGYTPAQFDLLVDYLLRVCEGTDHEAIGDTFVILAGLRGSPSPELRHPYIETTVMCMGQDLPVYVRHAAMSAASAVRTEVASRGREDESFRELFSQNLTSAISDPEVTSHQQISTPHDDKPFYEHALYVLHRDLCYLNLLCTLVQEPIWHGDLVRNGHISSCLAIADTSTCWTDDFNLCAVHILRVFAILDAIGDHEAHPIFSAVKAYPSWPLIVRGWGFIFCFSIFTEVTAEGWQVFSSEENLEALSSTVAYAQRHWQNWENMPDTGRLISLVDQVCGKLEEEKRRREQGVVSSLGHGRDESSENQGIPELGKEVRRLLRKERR